MYDLIIVPGGGVRSDGSVAPWVENRLDRALAVRTGEPVLCLSAGTVHKPPPLDRGGWPIVESAAGARYLVDRGLDPEAILTETASWDTIGNAYFARTIHTDPRGWRNLLVINSAFHMPRLEAIFRWVFSLTPDRGYSIDFDTLPDVGMPEADLEYRRRREQASLLQLPSLFARIQTLGQMHEFVFGEHGAYRAASLVGAREQDPPELQRVY